MRSCLHAACLHDMVFDAGSTAPLRPCFLLVQRQPTQGAQQSHQYAVVFDAGSTGTRAYVFKFTGAGKSLRIVNDTNDKRGPGLSSFTNVTEAMVTTIQPL